MNTSKQVKQLLTENPEMRDNPKKLIRRALQEVYGVNVLSAMIIAEKYMEVERIMRSNRQIQSKNEELRGKKWGFRKNVLAPKVKSLLGYK